ncbi:CDP-alcohol phosphatidyltransferase family protein [Thiotrichales bacterium 19S3-7]|nr:CDP-alcohol phosphatidyltransferase family protein [Thiotrichales bacterium 19S3-7]MCF6803000.1 CDP-alcohol phosphatidyltransferase family protein [Thiotrichales bacterium 19S3-11]
MLEQSVRKPYQKFLVNWVANQLNGKIHPITITFLSLLAGLIASIAILLDYPLFAIFFLLVSGYLDTLDGTVARISQTQSDLGCILDIISDRSVEIMVILSLCFFSIQTRAAPGLLMLASIILCISAFLVIGIFTTNRANQGKSFFYSHGLMERAETFIFFIIMISIPNLFIPLAYLFSLLVFITAFLHIFRFFLWSKKHQIKA